MAKRMLADVLWEAANVWLCRPGGWDGHDGTLYSCNAAMWAEMPIAYCNAGSLEPLRERSKACAFLKTLGCPVNSMYAFRGAHTDDMQGVRYMWLLLAMHVAEDEGIEV